jgi:outer membrane protein assembly factor BamD (BamD/ComL family)
MSVAGILGSILFAGPNTSAAHNKSQQIQQEFQQLGQDLQSGNLSLAQSDFAELQQSLPVQQNAASNVQSGSSAANPVSQVIAQLGQDLKAGNLSAARSDFSTLQQDFQQQGVLSSPRHHHRLHVGTSQDSSEQSSAATLFGDLSQEIQSGNLTAAQQTYSALQQDFLQFASGNATAGASILSGSTFSSGLNVSA